MQVRAHTIENGIITNTIEVENLDFLPNLIDASIGGNIGWGYTDGVLTPPVPKPEPVPTSVTMRQARLQLLALGSLSAINTAIPTMPEASQIDWEYAADVQRTFPLVVAMQQMFGWDDSQMDTFFVEAAKL